MPIQRYTDAPAFYDKAIGFLCGNEAMNNLPIGILRRGKDGKEHSDWWMALQTQEEKISLVSVMTPPFNVVLCAGSEPVGDAELAQLAHALIDAGMPLRGVTAEIGLARRFADICSDIMGCTVSTRANLRCYELRQVEGVPIVGTLRRAEPRDLFYIPHWRRAMAQECGIETDTLEGYAASTMERMGEGASSPIFVLEADGGPVSIAALTRTLPHGRTIGGVYTPPYFRRKGYATSCVALVSKAALAMGNEYCALFTDLANPISNSIYQKIGYRPVGDFIDLSFTKV